MLGDIPSSTFLDLAFGIENEKYTFELFVANATDEDAPLSLRASAPPASAASSPTACSAGRGRSASASSRTSERGTAR